MALSRSLCRPNNALTSLARSQFAARFFSRSDSSSEKHILLDHIHKNESDTMASISILTLNRPKANAMGKQMIHELSEAIQALETTHSDTRCVILTSHSNRVFSAGADLKERSTMTLHEAQDFVTNLRNTFEQFSRLLMPSIAAIEGVAVGGGLELALACDLRVASAQATLGLPETSLAIIPGAGGTQRLTRLLGISRAKQMIFTADRVDGTTAKEYGLVQYVVEPKTCLDFATELAWKIAGHGPIAIRAAKQAMDQGMDASSMEEALDIERENYAKILPTDDRLEGLAAFKEGRSPNYRGK